MADDELLVLREQLPLPKPYVAPASDTERRLAAIWCTALSMDRVGIADSYHDLGGDSVLAAVIFGEIEDTFAITLSMATLVDRPTIAELAAKIDAMTATGRD